MRQSGPHPISNLNGSGSGSLNPNTFSDQTPVKSSGYYNRDSSISGGGNHFFSAFNQSDMHRFGSAQVSGAGDDKSAIDYHTAF
jgi:hypothetical protein